MTGSVTLNLNRNPVNNKLQSGYNGANTLTVANDGSGAPNVIVFENWMDKTVGTRAPQGNWDAGLYGVFGAEAFPMYYDLAGFSGIGSMNAKPVVTYTIVVQNSSLYRLTLDGVVFTYNSSGSATASEIVSALTSQINANNSVKATASGTTTLILTRKNQNVPFYVFNIDTLDTFGNPNQAGANGISDYGMTGFTKLLGANTTEFFAAWQMGVPNGYFFSGATAEQGLPPQSNLKMIWWSDQTLDSAARADVVSRSRNSTNTWAFLGNQVNVNLASGSTFDWGVPNTFFSYFSAGADPFLDNGTAKSLMSNSAGTTQYQASSAPLFARRTTLTFTVQNTATYTATINGVPCTYISSASATATEIATGLASAINTSASAYGAASRPVASEVSFDPVVRTLPTISVTGNITKFDYLPYFDRLQTVWQGNDNQVNTLHVYPWMYIAIGANKGNFVALGNASSLAACTKMNVLKHSTWTTTGGAGGGTIQCSYTDKQKLGMTHWYRFVDMSVVDSGALS